jgi:hypothetical protein
MKGIEVNLIKTKDGPESQSVQFSTGESVAGHGETLTEGGNQGSASWAEVTVQNNQSHCGSATEVNSWRVVNFRKQPRRPGESTNMVRHATEVSSNAAVVTAPHVNVVSRQFPVSRKIYGLNTPTSSIVKPGINLVRKAVFHIDNVDGETTIDSLKKFLQEIDIKALTCFFAKSWLKGEGSEFVKAFRVCIPAEDQVKLMSPSLWPMGVIIRKWQFKGPQNGERH